ncbi:MAG: selenide, water dikinase SelD [Promethearchaeota archaeon]|nr:MAG: selenide, water dikinase SelD [Candidatus Lokiarchaeota archaeon]
MAIVKTTDIFTPLVDDGYVQGQITACNVTNDIYAMGVVDITGVLVFEAFPYEMPHELAVAMLKGFADFAHDLNAPVVGGHTIINPWPLLGGTAIGISHPSKITYSSTAQPGDTLILTKALGTQPAMAIYRLLNDPQVSLADIFPNLKPKELEELPLLAIKAMTTSDKPVAEIIHEIKINACTDVTGFGLSGHAGEMAENSKVDVTIELIPVFNKAIEISNVLGYGLEKGLSAETAGGLLLSVQSDTLDLILSELKKKNIPAYQVGKVTAGTGKTTVIDSVEILNVKAV